MTDAELLALLRSGVIPNHPLSPDFRGRHSKAWLDAGPEPAPPALVWPMHSVQGCEPVITSAYGPRGKGYHRGADIMLTYHRSVVTGRAKVYKDVYWCPGPFIAVEAGQVMQGGAWQIIRQDNGTRFWIESEDGSAWGYFHGAHLRISGGDIVEQGQTLCDPAGRQFTWPPHVHLERCKEAGIYRPVDPGPELAGARVLAG